MSTTTMALDDGSLKNESHFLEPMPCGSENLSPYSNTSGYSDTQNYYATEYDWQQQDQQQQQHHQHQQQSQHLQHQPQQQQPPHPQHLQTHPIHESNLRYYGSFADSIDLNASGYPNFNAHHMASSDYFPNNPALWTVGQTDAISSNNMTPHSRFFSGVDLSQQVGVPQMSPNSGSHGKPKRKRVQSHTQRKAANVRERRRMFHLNEAFDDLRKRLPAFNYEKRLSRIETLRLAMTYISFMKDVSVGKDPKCVKLLKTHDDEPGMHLSLDNLGLKSAAYPGNDEDTDDGEMIDSDDCSSGVHSLQCV